MREIQADFSWVNLEGDIKVRADLAQGQYVILIDGEDRIGGEVVYVCDHVAVVHPLVVNHGSL